MQAGETGIGARATRREWIGLAVLALPCMLYSMDLTVLNLAIPTLTAELRPSAGQMLWIIDIYGFMVAGFLITMGTLGDRIGRRKLLLIGAAAFAAASAVAAFSNSAAMLIVMRAVLGIAGATLAPSTLSLITVMFQDEKQRSFAISMWIASFSAGAIVGPVVGGLLIEHFWWGSVFLIAIPVMVLLLLLGPALLPEYKAPEAGRLDLPSAGMSLASVLAIIFGIKHAAETGFGPVAAGSIGLGLAVAALFVRRQGRLADPMIDLGLFCIPAFTGSLVVNLASVMFMFGTFIFVAQYFQLVAGLSPLEAGLWSLPSAMAFALTSFVVPALSERLAPAILATCGLGIAALGFVWLALAPDLIQIVAASVVFSVGFTPVIASTTTLVVGAAPPERMGAASAMSETAAELGGALGVALLGSLGAALYRIRMLGIDLPGVPPETAAEARATLGGALAIAAGLDADEANALIQAARSAFMAGFQAAAMIAVLGMIVCAAIALTLLRRLRPVGH
jgi:DHA2 family multidrug resistance protein-like MFS transporter